MTWSFRLHFRLSKDQRLTASDDAYEAPVGTADGAVLLRSTTLGRVTEPVESVLDLPRTPIRVEDHLALHASGYATREDAEQAASRWRARLSTAFASMRLGADFGAREVGSSYIGPRGEQLFRRHAGLPDDDERRVFADHLGVHVFETEPGALFDRRKPELIGTAPVESLAEALGTLVDSGYVPPEEHRLAYDLWAASHFPESVDAQFLLRMMALETLIDQELRPAAVREHVDHLIAETRTAELGDEQTRSLVSILGQLKRESITQAGKRLARTLAPRRYGDRDPETFFADCYSLRSALAHGRTSRTSARIVALYGEQLRQFVADLLSGPLLHDIGGVVHPSIVALWDRSSVVETTESDDTAS